MDVFLDRQEHLVRIDGLDEVVGDFRADGFVHDVLFFGLGDHHDGGRGGVFLDPGEGFESGHPGHHFVEDDEVEGFLLHHLDGVVAVVAGFDFVSFVLQKQEVGFQEFDLIVYPQNPYVGHVFLFCRVLFYSVGRVKYSVAPPRASAMRATTDDWAL